MVLTFSARKTLAALRQVPSSQSISIHSFPLLLQATERRIKSCVDTISCPSCGLKDAETSSFWPRHPTEKGFILYSLNPQILLVTVSYKSLGHLGRSISRSKDASKLKQTSASKKVQNSLNVTCRNQWIPMVETWDWLIKPSFSRPLPCCEGTEAAVKKHPRNSMSASHMASFVASSPPCWDLHKEFWRRNWRAGSWGG